MDDIIRFAPSHLKQVLGGFGGHGAQAADKDDMFGVELREQNEQKIAKRIVKKDIEDEALNG